MSSAAVRPSGAFLPLWIGKNKEQSSSHIGFVTEFDYLLSFCSKQSSSVFQLKARKKHLKF